MLTISLHCLTFSRSDADDHTPEAFDQYLTAKIVSDGARRRIPPMHSEEEEKR